jgi:hypothetical protein
MRILIVCTHYAVCSGHYMADAFKRLGHEVRTVGPARDNKIWGMTVDPKFAWEPTYIMYEKNGIYSADLDYWRPDLVLQMDSEIIGTGTLWPDVPHAVFGVDNHVRRYDTLQGNFSHYFLSHHDGPCMPVDNSNPKHTWLPCGYDPSIFTPSPIPFDDREYDVCMVGVMYGRRIQLIETMRQIGLKVFASTGLLYDEYRDAYWNSRISLCSSFCGDVAMRVFETMAMGCMVLTDPCVDFDRLGMDPGIYAVRYDNFGAAAALAHAMITIFAPSAKATIERGLAWVLPHTWDARAQKIIETLYSTYAEAKAK